MIGYLKGTLLEIEPNLVLLDVGGVGYDLHVPLSTYYEVQKREPGGTAAFWVHTHVREDALALFGFWTERERRLFRRLIAVSGIGPKLAQTILSGMLPGDLIAALSAGDARRLNSIPGVGKKTAERMILELQDKVSDLAAAAPAAAPAAAAAFERDLVAALVGLGYKNVAARRAVAAALDEQPDAEFADLLKASLARLSRV